jgi:excisionase family DNA binding protein
VPQHKKESQSSSVSAVPSEGLLTVQEVAVVLRLSVSTIRSWVLLRRIPFVKLHNKAIRFKRTEIDALIAASVIPAEQNGGVL